MADIPSIHRMTIDRATERLYNLSNLEAGIRRCDVGVDANGYYPVSINQIENFFKSIMQEEGTL